MMDANCIFSQSTHTHACSPSVSMATCLLPLLSVVLLNTVAALVSINKILTINVCGHEISSVALFYNNPFHASVINTLAYWAHSYVAKKIMCCEYQSWGRIQNPSFSSELTEGPDKLKFLSLASFSNLEY